MIPVSSPEAFAAAVDEYVFEEVALEVGGLAEADLVLVGEAHGVRQTPSAVYALACALETRAIGLEWSHEEMDAPLQAFVRSGSLELEELWQLPREAEFFSGDGRITAGHFALLRRLRDEGRLEQVIAFDRLDPQPRPEWQIRDLELAERLLAEWDRSLRLLALAGAFHARVETGTMAATLAARLAGLRTAMLQYADAPAMPAAPVVFRLPPALPAVVPAFPG